MTVGYYINRRIFPKLLPNGAKRVLFICDQRIAAATFCQKSCTFFKLFSKQHTTTVGLQLAALLQILHTGASHAQGRSVYRISIACSSCREATRPNRKKLLLAYRPRFSFSPSGLTSQSHIPVPFAEHLLLFVVLYFILLFFVFKPIGPRSRLSWLTSAFEHP